MNPRGNLPSDASMGLRLLSGIGAVLTAACGGGSGPCDERAFFADADGAGFGDAAVSTDACEPPDGTVEDSSDCDDSDPTVHVGSPTYADADGDGFGVDGSVEDTCGVPEGRSERGGDCNDDDAAIHPEATEVPCDGIDDDCDGFPTSASEEAPAYLGTDHRDSIQSALDGSTDGATVWVCPGVHLEALVVPTGRDVTIAGSTGVVEDVVLDGEGAHAILVAEGGRLVVEALSFRGGSAVLGDDVVGGAAIRTHAGDLEVHDCQFDTNRSTMGGAVYFEAADASADARTLEVTTTTFADNEAYASAGGAIYVALHVSEYAIIRVLGSTFEQNVGSGGAIAIFSEGTFEATIEGSTFVENDAEDDGAVLVRAYGPTGGSDVFVRDSAFERNRADGGAGAVEVNGSATVELDGTRFVDNVTGGVAGELDAGPGGAIWVSAEQLSLTACELRGNRAATGGALALGDAGAGAPLVVDVADTMFDGSHADSGGAIWVDPGSEVGITMSGGSVTSSESTDAAVVLRASSTFSCDATDFGEGATDNVPADLTTGAETRTDLGAATTIDCADGACR